MDIIITMAMAWITVAGLHVREEPKNPPVYVFFTYTYKYHDDN